MRLGGLHLTMAFIISIGKLYGDDGLLSMLVDSDVYAPATARLLIEGKHVARGIRGLKLVQDALYRLYYSSFWAWLQHHDHTELQQEDIHKLLTDIQHAFEDGDQESARSLTTQRSLSWNIS